ncbi:MAG: 23S rRNA (uracil(1939)-C(5))-methyltransferase RlmD [Spirochaetales bacterium]|nr:23S rRNA (uracil(1939)-C(5))-methyltransferase RlmD [Spirochaetales bacterium]
MKSENSKSPASWEKPQPCRQFRECGGCQLLDRTYGESLEYKQRILKKQLGSFGKINPILGMDNPWCYRNKSHSTFAYDPRKGVRSGLYAEHSHRLVPVDRCLLQDERADAIVGTVKSLMKSFKMTAYDEKTGRGFLRHVLIKVGFRTGEIMVVLVVTSHIFPGKNNYVKALRQKHPEITTIVQNINAEETTMVLGEREIVLYGRGYIRDTLCEMDFQISPKSFYQINPVQTEALYNKAMDMAGLTGKEIVLDAYSGIGTIGLIASRRAAAVIGVELNGDAVKNAQQNARLNRVGNITFHKGDAGRFMTAMARDGQKLDMVFLDPPRSGSNRGFIQSVGRLRPGKVVYISCGPESLARDLVWFREEGYEVREIQPVDMFPWTEHIETCVLLEFTPPAKSAPSGTPTRGNAGKPDGRSAGKAPRERSHSAPHPKRTRRKSS